MFKFEVLTTTQTRSSKSCILCLCLRAIRAKQAKVHFTKFVQRDQHGIINRETLNLMQSSIFSLIKVTFMLQQPS